MVRSHSRKRVCSLLGMFSMSIAGFVFATQASSEVLYKVHFKASNSDERSEVARYVHPDYMDETTAYSIVREVDLRATLRGIPQRILKIEPMSVWTPDLGSLSGDIRFPKKDAAYHTPMQVVKELTRLAALLPEQSELLSLGKTAEGNDILGIRLAGDLSSSDTNSLMILGTHHAREHISTEVPLLFVKHVAEDLNPQERTAFLKGKDIYIFPILNVDGVNYDLEGGKYKYWRKSRRDLGGEFGVDLNRNYSVHWQTGGNSTSKGSDVYRGPSPFSEPETQAVKAFVEEHTNIKSMISFHSFSEVILYPWGGLKQDPPEQDRGTFESLAKDMAKFNGYGYGSAAKVMYVASGETCDWAYKDHQIFCFTIELSPKSALEGGFYPGSEIIKPTFEKNLGAIKILAERTMGL